MAPLCCLSFVGRCPAGTLGRQRMFAPTPTTPYRPEVPGAQRRAMKGLPAT